MTDSSKPFLAVYVVWHPRFENGRQIAMAVREHFYRSIFENVSGGKGISVVYRQTPAPNSVAPLSIDLAEAETTAILVLIDSNLVNDSAWTEYFQDLVKQAEENGLRTRIFPVFIESKLTDLFHVSVQAFRWDNWEGSTEQKLEQLIGNLTYEICRMLRHYLAHLEHSIEPESGLQQYLEKVQIFLSHSKKDPDNNGERIARAIRKRIHEHHTMSSFFDIHDIPVGLEFHKVLSQQVRSNAMIAIHTDSYSSRTWCRKEVILAKLKNRPLVVANCISNFDDRCFPYMGNVPNIRLEVQQTDRIDFLIFRLLDEILKDFLWQCRVRLHCPDSVSSLLFIPRSPELISLASLPDGAADKDADSLIVYPDPPISEEEKILFTKVAPSVRLLSIMEWIAEK